MSRLVFANVRWCREYFMLWHTRKTSYSESLEDTQDGIISTEQMSAFCLLSSAYMPLERHWLFDRHISAEREQNTQTPRH